MENSNIKAKENISHTMNNSVNFVKSKNETTKFNFVNEPFVYDFEYDTISKTIYIKATHMTEFLMWTRVISDKLSDNTSKNVKLELSPLRIFKIMYNFSMNKSSNIYKIIFPKEYKDIDVPLPIEIVANFSDNDEFNNYDDEDDDDNKYCDIKFIQLNPEKVSDDKRFDMKLKYLKHEIFKKYDHLLDLNENCNNDDNVKTTDLYINAEYDAKLVALQKEFDTYKTNNDTKLTTLQNQFNAYKTSNSTQITNIQKQFNDKITAIQKEFNDKIAALQTTCDAKYVVKT
jgi:hypothetical protein